jgi:hypothetical protein
MAIERIPFSEQVRSVNIARRMVDAGAALAVMGNHELNAIAWHTPDPNDPGEYLRPRNSPKWGGKNRQQHAAFLAEVEHDPALHAELIDWFLTLPLWIDLPTFRVVHACPHARFLEWLKPRLHRERHLTRELMVAATDEPADEAEKDNSTPGIFKAVEALTKGIEVAGKGGPLVAYRYDGERELSMENFVSVNVVCPSLGRSLDSYFFRGRGLGRRDQPSCNSAMRLMTSSWSTRI